MAVTVIRNRIIYLINGINECCHDYDPMQLQLQPTTDGIHFIELVSEGSKKRRKKNEFMHVVKCGE